MDDTSQDSAPPAPGRGYRFCRALVRLWFALSFRKIRLLGAENLPESGPTLLAVGHPASFLDALILLSALNRPVSCLIPRKFIQGFWRGLWARRLKMVPYEPEAVETPRRGVSTGALLAKCEDALAGEVVLALFADPAPQDTTEKAWRAETIDSIALGVEARSEHRAKLVVLPVHLYLPVGRSQSSRVLIYINSRLLRCENLTSGSRSGAFAELLESRWRENPFRLQAEDLKWFTSDLEGLLRANLEDDWASRANWKQKVEGFRLSGIAAAWAEQANYLHPGRLVALREAVEAIRRSQRRGSLRQAEVEAARDWLDSPLRRGWVWFESLLGLPVALYGLGNHLLALLILFWAGLLERENDRDPTTEWLLRGAVLVGCYAGQILVVAYLLGRSAAGYYAPTLPVTGLYAWRYFWLLRHRTRVTCLALLLPAQARGLLRRRQELVAEFDETLRTQAELLGVMKV
jgi:hypothetical protein